MTSASYSRRPAILITGGAGFIGSHLCSALLARGRRVVVLDDLSAGRLERLELSHAGLTFVRGDASSPERLHALLRGSGPFQSIVHLAARVGVRRVLAAPEECRTENIRLATALVEALERLPRAERPRLFAASTSEVYAEQRAPLREDDPLRSLTGRKRWAYAASKLSAERAFDAAAESWEPAQRPVHLRFFNVVGFGQGAEAGMVLPTFIDQALRGEPLSVHRPGTQVRTFAYVDDVAQVLAQLLASDVPAGPLNVGGSARCTVGELAQAVLEATGSGAGVRLVDPRVSVAAHFEEVEWREPCTRRLARLNLPSLDCSLTEIVTRTVAATRVAREQLRRSDCASPAS